LLDFLCELKLLWWPADIHSVTRSSRCRPATKVARWRTHGRNSFSEQNGRWLTDANLYKKIYVRFK